MDRVASENSAAECPCESCGYGLAGLGHLGGQVVCPECGKPQVLRPLDSNTETWSVWRFIAFFSVPWWLALSLRWTVGGPIGYVIAALSPVVGFFIGLAISDRLQGSRERSSLGNVMVFLALLLLTNALMGAAFVSIELVLGKVITR